MEENQSNIKENKKINFFQKVWYSIAKISKYDEMVNLGWKSAIKYFFGLLAILAVILTIGVFCVAIWSGTEITSNLYAYYALIYFFAHFIVLFLIYGLYIFLIVVCMFFVLKIFRIGEKLKDILSTTIYSSTLSIIIYVIYLIISYFSGLVISYFDSIALIIIFIYIGLNLRKKRGDIQNVFYRRNKKKSRK